MWYFKILESIMYDILHQYHTLSCNENFGKSYEWTLELIPYEIMGSCLGKCAVNSQKIYLNEKFVELAPYHTVLHTLRHECAHALAGIEFSSPDKNGKEKIIAHGKTWKKYALMLEVKPSSKTNIDDIGDFKDFILSSNKDKWVILLDDGKTIQRVSTSKRKIKNIESMEIKTYPNSFGKLWLLETKRWQKIKDSQKAIRQNMIR